MKKTPIIPSAWRDISDMFIALGDEHRQRILLSFEKEERLSIAQILEGSSLSRTALTHHLKVLERGGALCREKVGREVYFSVNKRWMLQALGNVQRYIEDDI